TAGFRAPRRCGCRVDRPMKQPGQLHPAEDEMTTKGIVTIERHIIDQERMIPEATGAFSRILSDIAIAAKVISREVNKAGLVEILGEVGAKNVHGENVRKLDVYADEVIYKALDHTGLLCCMASEENEEVLEIPAKFPTGNYALRSEERRE